MYVDDINDIVQLENLAEELGGAVRDTTLSDAEREQAQWDLDDVRARRDELAGQ